MSMKSFREYLIESKKVYTFKIKVAGELPENFVDNLKQQLLDCKCASIEKSKSTPIQSKPMDFPNLTNAEVAIFEVVCEYPVGVQEVLEKVKNTGISEANIIVRTGSDPGETEKMTYDPEPSGEAILAEPEYKDTKIKHKDYFGNDFNKGFLKDLEKTAKARKKEDGQGEYKLPKGKQDKAGAKSALGS